MKTVTKKPRSGGRPSKQEAGRIADRILDAAAFLFFTEGYGATSIEGIARRAKTSKRTFYDRYPTKADAFSAVVHRVIERLRLPENKHEYLFEGKTLEVVLINIAKLTLQSALSKDGLALYRMVLAEAARFPELALIVNDQGARRAAVRMISGLLRKEKAPHAFDAEFAAEQFLQMVTSMPQRRALGLGEPMTAKELDTWAVQTVALFLHGWDAKKRP